MWRGWGYQIRIVIRLFMLQLLKQMATCVWLAPSSVYFLTSVIAVGPISGLYNSPVRSLMDIKSYKMYMHGLIATLHHFVHLCLTAIVTPTWMRSIKPHSDLYLESFLRPKLYVLRTVFDMFTNGIYEFKVAISSWGSGNIPGDGIIIFPAQNSRSLLVGAVFLTGSFPAFMLHILPDRALPYDQSYRGHTAYHQHTISDSYVSPVHHHQSYLRYQ